MGAEAASLYPMHTTTSRTEVSVSMFATTLFSSAIFRPDSAIIWASGKRWCIFAEFLDARHFRWLSPTKTVFFTGGLLRVVTGVRLMAVGVGCCGGVGVGSDGCLSAIWDRKMYRGFSLIARGIIISDMKEDLTTNCGAF